VYLQTPKALWLFVRELLSVMDLLSICLPLKGCWVSFALCSSNNVLKRMMYPSISFLYPIVLLILRILTEPGLLWDQTLRVRSNSAIFKEDMTSCQVLWEVLALNIVHCELVTREEAPLKVDVASSSSSSSTVQPKDQQTWGGRSAHWIALRELGKLAMFTYRVPYAGNRGNKTD
jgi:hypothetical protein